MKATTIIAACALLVLPPALGRAASPDENDRRFPIPIPGECLDARFAEMPLPHRRPLSRAEIVGQVEWCDQGMCCRYLAAFRERPPKKLSAEGLGIGGSSARTRRSQPVTLALPVVAVVGHDSTI
jgi:hypothetical protein